MTRHPHYTSHNRLLTGLHTPLHPRLGSWTACQLRCKLAHLQGSALTGASPPSPSRGVSATVCCIASVRPATSRPWADTLMAAAGVSAASIAAVGWSCENNIFPGCVGIVLERRWKQRPAVFFASVAPSAAATRFPSAPNRLPCGPLPPASVLSGRPRERAGLWREPAELQAPPRSQTALAQPQLPRRVPPKSQQRTWRPVLNSQGVCCTKQAERKTHKRCAGGKKGERQQGLQVALSLRPGAGSLGAVGGSQSLRSTTVQSERFRPYHSCSCSQSDSDFITLVPAVKSGGPELRPSRSRHQER